MRKFTVTPKTIMAAARGGYNKLDAAAKKCAEVKADIEEFIYYCRNRTPRDVTESLMNFMSDAAYDIITHIWNIDGDKLKVLPGVDLGDIITLTFAEVEPSGQIITSPSGVLNYCTSLEEYREKYAGQDLIVKTLYLPSKGGITSSSGVTQGIRMCPEFPGLMGEVEDIFVSRGYKVHSNANGYSFYVVPADSTSPWPYYDGVRVEVGSSSNTSTDVGIPEYYFDILNNTVDIPEALISRIADKVNNAAAKFASKKDWPSSSYWLNLDEEGFEEAWNNYLSGLEEQINNKYQIFPEPSIQGGQGNVFIHDESGERDWDEEPVVDYSEWCNAEVDMAASSKSPAQYQKKYESYIHDIIGG